MKRQMRVNPFYDQPIKKGKFKNQKEIKKQTVHTRNQN